MIREVLRLLALEGDELSVYFVTTEDITELHGTFFQDPTPTDCITFPMDVREAPLVGPKVLGEVFICPKTALDYAPENPYLELSLYIVHTLLHLKGYDDQEEADILEMRSKEQEILSLLEQKNLVLSNPLLSIKQ